MQIICAVCYVKAKKMVKVNAKQISNYIIPHLAKKSRDLCKKIVHTIDLSQMSVDISIAKVYAIWDNIIIKS